MNKKGKVIVIIFCAELMMLTFGVGTAKATPSVPTVTPSGNNPVNVIWRGHAYAALVTASMIELGWVHGDTIQHPRHDAFAMLMLQDGVTGRWVIWIYEGGWDADWGYWSYASAGHYYFDPNPLHLGWYIDSWEAAEDKVYDDWSSSSSLPWNVGLDSYSLGNAGDYWNVYNDGSALRIEVYEYASGEGDIEWTQNSKFLLSGYQWDPILYDWAWSQEPFFEGTDTNEVFTYDDWNYALWNYDGLVELSALDLEPTDSYGRSARITYGPFLDPYPDEPPSPISVGNADVLTLKGVVSHYGARAIGITIPWAGIKFDAWFTDPANNGRLMVIEMYFTGMGLLGAWENEEFRTMGGGDIDDHLIKLQAFPEYSTIIGDQPPYNFYTTGYLEWDATVVLIDLKGIWQRAADHFGRSSDDLLYAVALDVESGSVIGGLAAKLTLR